MARALQAAALCAAFLSPPVCAEETTPTAPSLRAAVLTVPETLSPDPVPRDPRALGPDQWQTLNAAGTNFSLLYRAPAQAQASGTVLLVSDKSIGAASAARTTQLRLGLARQGYHTYQLSLPQEALRSDEDSAASIAGRVQAATAHLQASHGSAGGASFNRLIISEGAAGRWVTALQPSGIDGLVFVDVPVPARRIDNWLLKPTLPVLMVQTAPHAWPETQPLGATTELHLLPRQSFRGLDGPLVRTVRGWLKRLSAPAASKRS